MYGSRIIAVDPGRSTLGIAVFEGASLRYYATKALRVPGTPEDVRHAANRVLSSLIIMFRPSHMAIEQPLVVQKRARLLAHVISALKTTARRQGLIITEYAPQSVRRFVCGNARPTKREVAIRLAARYPELNRYVSASGRWSQLYYERMMGAVAVGLVANSMQDIQQGEHMEDTHITSVA
jgi:Holliday junction resolvasome RuvABC endonuclease subunit